MVNLFIQHTIVKIIIFLLLKCLIYYYLTICLFKINYIKLAKLNLRPKEIVAFSTYNNVLTSVIIKE